MAVSFNNSLGTWQIDGRGHYPTEEAAREAEAAQKTGSGNQVVNDDDFASSFGDNPRVLSPAGTAATATSSPTLAAERQKEFEASDALFRQGYQDLNADGKVTQEDVTLSGQAYGTPQNQGGTAANIQVQQESIGSRNMRTGRLNAAPVVSSETVMPGIGIGGGYNVPERSPSERSRNAAADTQQAENAAKDKQQETSAENDWLNEDAIAGFRNLQGGQYGLSDEARGYQKEGLQQQRMLLERLFDFNEDEYAAQFGDQTLSRMIAAGRQGTSAAEQQAGRFAALEQAPAVYAEGRQQAASLANQRLGMAQDAAKAFGDLGTMTRGQDETRAQFEAQLPLEIQKQIAALTQGKMQLNQREAEVMSQIWMEFAQLQSVYAGMDSTEMMAWWNDQTAKEGQRNQFEMLKEQLRAQGAVTDKDILNGIFQLGGGLLGLAGRGGAR